MSSDDYYPFSIVKAWNILCEAVRERVIFYNNVADFNVPVIDDVPAARRISSMIPTIRNRIISLVEYSLDWRNFGKWDALAGFGSISKPESEFYKSWQIDGYAFLGKAPYLPYRRHSLSAFIHAASEIVRQAVRYPAMQFSSSPSGKGFIFDATASAEFLETGEKFSGTWLDEGNIDTGSGVFIISDLTLYQRGIFRGQWHNIHWFYRPGKANRGGYHLPQLRGNGYIRSHVTAKKFRQPNRGVEEADLGIQTFRMDFDSGSADGYFDVSAVSNWCSEIYNETDASVVQGWVTVNLDLDKQLLLTAENFPVLPYKFLCDQRSLL